MVAHHVTMATNQNFCRISGILWMSPLVELSGRGIIDWQSRLHLLSAIISLKYFANMNVQDIQIKRSMFSISLDFLLFVYTEVFNMNLIQVGFRAK